MVTFGRGTSRGEAAYQDIRERLLAGRWKAGETLSTYALANELQVSRTTVMTALKRLEAECYLEIVPQVGCIVRGASAQEVRDLFLVRSAIEGVAAEIAAGRISEEQIGELRRNLERSAAAVAQDDAAAYQALNHDFHAMIVRASGVSLLETTLAALWQRKEYEPSNVAFFHGRMKHSLAEHREIVERLSARDSAGARMSVERHIRDASHSFMQAMPVKD